MSLFRITLFGSPFGIASMVRHQLRHLCRRQHPQARARLVLRPENHRQLGARLLPAATWPGSARAASHPHHAGSMNCSKSAAALSARHSFLFTINPETALVTHNDPLLSTLPHQLSMKILSHIYSKVIHNSFFGLRTVFLRSPLLAWRRCKRLIFILLCRRN